MVKNDLRDGMVVEYKSGGFRKIIGNGLYSDGIRQRDMNTVRLDLSAYYDGESIIAVYSPIWKSNKDIKKVTMSEVCEKFGEEVMIIS